MEELILDDLSRESEINKKLSPDEIVIELSDSCDSSNSSDSVEQCLICHENLIYIECFHIKIKVI
jgi:hypothetical protein